MSTEVWKDIPGFEGLYQASNKGQIKSLPRTIERCDGIVYRHKGRVLEQCISKRGYPHVVLRRAGKDVSREVHTLIAAAFLGPRCEGDEVIRHLDGDPTNNRIENLSYGTLSQNQLDLYDYRGYHHKLTPTDVQDIRRRLRAGDKGRDIAKTYGVSESNISCIKHRGTYKWLA